MATGNTCNICLIRETSQCEKASGKVPVSFAPNEKEINGRPDGTLGGVAAKRPAFGPTGYAIASRRFWLETEIRQSSGAEATGQILFDLCLWNTGHAPFVSGFDPGANFLIPGELDVVALGGSTDIEQSVPAPGGPGGSVRLLRM